MQRIFASDDRISDSMVVLEGDEYKHIVKSLRMKVGEELLVSMQDGKEYLTKISEIDEDQNLLKSKIVDVFASAAELPAKIILFQGYPKQDKLEFIVQKAVELGAYEIVPVMMDRCVVKLTADKVDKKTERLNKIAKSAAEQSRRGIVPNVSKALSLKDALEYAKSLDMILLPYENAEGLSKTKQIIKEVSGAKSIGIFIGPEGGFAPEEVALIEAAGGKTITLGHRILRTETAGMVMLSLLMIELDRD